MIDSPYLLFDLDGTLVDSLPDLELSLNILRQELGYGPLTRTQVSAMIGDGASQLVKRALGEDIYQNSHLKRFMGIYETHLLDNTSCYPGIVQLLNNHPPERLGVVTNKPSPLTIKLLTGLQLIDAFKVIVGGDSLEHKKPHPLPVRFAIETLSADPAQTIMIGDHHTDLNAGRAAGTRTCFCEYGIGHSDDLPFDFYAAESTDLLNLFPG